MKIRFFKITVLAMAILVLVNMISPAQEKASREERYGEVTATLAELQTLVDAMTVVYIDIGYYVTIENLNDMIIADPTYDFDNIDQYGGTWVIDTDTAFFRDEKIDLTVPPRLWQGPYVNYQQQRISIDGKGYDRGSLLDYWGTPYYLFSPAGLVRGDQVAVTNELYGDYFDVYAIVSLGPDGIMSEDDLWRTFGMPPTRLVITSTSVPSAYPGDEVSIKGYNLGSNGATARQNRQLLLAGEEIHSITEWTPTRVSFLVPAGAESGNLKIINDGEESNAIYLEIRQTPTSAFTWTLYH